LVFFLEEKKSTIILYCDNMGQTLPNKSKIPEFPKVPLIGLPRIS